MAKIKPFKAVTYNREKIKGYSKVVCPPYDVISPQRQEYYHSLDPYNFIHILLGTDVPGEDKYLRAANYFRDWLKSEVLIQEKEPAIYFYSQQYKVKGEKRTRLGFIALLGLGDEKSPVFAHENTHLAPKEDRHKLLRQVKANLSPIFVVFLDKKRIIQRTFQQYIRDKEPFIDVIDDENTSHKLWKIDDPALMEAIKSRMEGENIFIADGHHRYEVACAYREEMKQKLGPIDGEEDFNYILTYFTNTDPRGLTILPVHRLIKLESGFNFDSFKLKLKEYFDIEEIKDKAKFFFLMEKGGRSEHLLGMYKDKKYWFLRLKNIKILDKMISDKPKEYRSLDVCILNYIILNKILGLGLEDKESLTYSPDANDLIERVDKDPLYIALFLNPVKIEQIVSVAVNSNKMPPKSTYFYPKVLSGLLINKFEES